MCQGGKPGTGKLYTDVWGAWSMALGLRQSFEYYYYIYQVWSAGILLLPSYAVPLSIISDD